MGYLDITDSSHQCPSGFTEHSDSNILTCRRTDTSAGCGSVMMDVLYQYSRVCGRVRAYQVSTTNAFLSRSSASLDSAYVDDVSLTHGSPDSTSGHLLLDSRKIMEIIMHLFVPVMVVPHPNQPLLEMTIFVTREIHFICVPHQVQHFFLLTRCGMGMVVGIRAPAAHSTILHGSTSSSHSQPLTTLR